MFFSVLNKIGRLDRGWGRIEFSRPKKWTGRRYFDPRSTSLGFIKRISGCFVFAFLCSQKVRCPGSHQIRARKCENQDLLISECIRCLCADLLTECALSLLGIVSLILATGLQAAPDWPLPEWVARALPRRILAKIGDDFPRDDWFDRAKNSTARNFNRKGPLSLIY